MSKSDIVIAAYSETPVQFKSGRSAYDLAGEAFAQLLERSGIAKSEIDGLSVTVPLSECSNPFFAVYMSEALGISPTWMNYGGTGGCSATGGVARAMSAIRDGHCEVAMVMSADAPSTRWAANYGAYRGEFQDPQGVQGPPAVFGLLMSRYAYQYDLKPEALAKIAITQRNHALLNENGLEKFRKPLSEEDYFASKVIADPLRVLDSVMFCDGANAFLVMKREKADALGIKTYVYPTAYAELTNVNGSDPLADVTETGFSKIAPKIWQQSGLKPSDISMFQPYDDFTIAVLMKFEDFGFCGRGEGSDFVLSTDLSFKGSLPLNTGGGQISAGQPGLASGGLNLAEAVRQLMGEGGERQVANPKNALVTGIGVIPFARNWGTSAAMILEV
ncbi:thiolase family protein [Pseudochrobactrum asaccharolyticum]|uniref:Acetyl-CoA acetyltransferase n=1 Tax=Pseudochrobactrum asaccharolyticum TaxID=354351 RepID=A0A366DK08_9HYPH|nr:thiolase family protein [Pseudochrobactrum asaccharolyticum]MBX8802364.1 thiolase family protein [Ochrobactrum sp. MR28]MBX8817882.1 thiolase family protein [Ochrobactrum sp. MR31]RBO90410.1 acetyl-CoA acetyltransferase [Pseudochrobactrum asaccharolyticum]